MHENVWEIVRAQGVCHSVVVGRRSYRISPVLGPEDNPSFSGDVKGA